MCLYTTTDIPSVATEDIHVKKVLKRVNFRNRTLYITPYQYAVVGEDGVLCPKNDLGIKISNDDDYTFIIDGGMIHSYVPHKSKDYYRYGFTPEHDVFDAIIPKGSKYYEGVSSDGYESYASDKLIINLSTEYNSKIRCV